MISLKCLNIIMFCINPDKCICFRLLEECGVAMYCDLHAHSRKHNIFIYGCENRRGTDRRLQEQVFPLMLHKNAVNKVSFFFI